VDYNDFELTVEVDGIALPYGTYTLSIVDAIDSFYPTGLLIISDQSGLLYENLFFVQGMPLTASIQYEDGSFYQSNWIIEKVFSDDVERMDVVGGNVFVRLVYPDYYNLEKTSKGFNGEPSSIVQGLLSDFGVEKTLVEASDVPEKIWIQQNETNSEFIERLRCYSHRGGVPYISFIDTMNTFYFQPIDILSGQPSQATAVLQDSEADPDADLFIMNMKINNLGGDEVKDHFLERRYALDESGALTEEDVTYNTLWPNGGQYISLTPQEKLRKIQFSPFENPTYKQAMPSVAALETMTIVTSFFPSLHSGMMMELNLETEDSDGDL
jgi:hypothetical protein